MGCVININGLATTSRNAPFGVSVSLTNSDQVDVNSQTWDILAYPRDLTGAPPDFATNFAAWTVQPNLTYRLVQAGPGPFAAVTFTPDVTGTYLVKLTCATSTGNISQTAVVRVADTFVGEYVPAAGESVEAGTLEGWARERNRSIKYIGRRVAKGSFVRVANLSGSSIARGLVVRVSDYVDAHGITPNVVPGGGTVQPERIPSVVLGHASDVGAADFRYLVMDETVANNGTGMAQISGVFEGGADVDYSGFVVGALIYLSDTGTQSPTPGTTTLVIGHVIKATAGTGAALIEAALTNGITSLTADVVASGPGAAAATIQPDVVSNTKLRNSAALSVIGRSANSTGDPADIAAGSDGDVLRRSGTALGFGAIPEASVTNLIADLAARVPTTRALTAGAGMTGGGDLTADRTFNVVANVDGTIVVNADDIQAGVMQTANIANNAVTDATIRQFAGLSVLGRAVNSTGNGADITAGSDGNVLWRNGTTLAFAALPYARLTGAPTLFYQTTANAGSALPQQPLLNFSGGLLAVDNAGATRTDVTTSITATQVGYGGGSNTLVSSNNWTFAAATSQTRLLGDATTGEPGLTYRRSRGTVASPAAITNTDYVWRQYAEVFDGTGWTRTGEMGVHVTPGSTIIAGNVSSQWYVKVGTADPYAGAGAVSNLLIASGGTVSVGLNPVGSQTLGTSTGGVLNVYGPTQTRTLVVGPGGSFPNTKLMVTNDSATDNGRAVIRNTNNGSGSYASLGFSNDSNAVEATMLYTATTFAGVQGYGAHNLVLNNPVGDIIFAVGGASPVLQALSVALDGRVQMQNSAAAVSASGASAVRSNGNKLQYSENGGAWANFTDVGSGTFVPLTRTLTAGAGLTGGGDLTVNRTFDVVAADATIVVNADSIQAGVMQTANIADDAVSNAKAANMATARIKGRVTAGTGDPEDLTGTQATTLLDVFTSSLKGLTPASGGGTATFLRADGTWAAPAGTITSVTASPPLLSSGGTTPHITLTYNSSLTLDGSNQLQVAAFSGDVTKPAGSNTTTLANIPSATPMAGYLLATAIVAPGTPAAGRGSIYVDSTSKNIAVKDDAGVVKHGVQTVVAVSHQFVTAISDAGVVTLAQPAYTDLSGSVPAITSLTTDVVAAGPGAAAATIQPGVVTNAKLANMATARFKGRITAGTGDPEDLTGTQATTLLDVFTSALKGLAPASGGGTTNFLRADGTWAAPPAGGGGSVSVVTGTPPIVITSTPTSTPNVTIQGAFVSGSTTTTAQNLGALSTGLLKGTVSGGVSTISTATANVDYVATSRTFSTTAPLTGGGDMSANRTLGINTVGGFRLLAGDAGGTSFATSNEVRLDSDNLWISNDGWFVHQNTTAGGFQAANYERVRAFWLGSVWSLKSEKGGTGTSVRAMRIDADTANLTLNGASLTFAQLSGSGSRVLQVDAGGNVDTIIGPAGASYKWSIAYEASSTGIAENFKTVVGLADVGFFQSSTGGISAPGGTAPETTLAGVFGTAAAVPMYRTAYAWAGGRFYVQIPFMSVSGTGTGTLRVGLFSCQGSVSSSASYTLLGFVDLSFSSSTVASIGASTSLSGVISPDSHILAVAYRTDNNAAITPVITAITATLELFR
jgi:hypothetical protein